MFQPTVFLVEDDQAVRESLVWMLQQHRIRVEAYTRPSDLLTAYDPTKLGCLVFDLLLPEMSGLELYSQLIDLGCQHTFIIITGHGEVADATNAWHAGAVDFIQKPINRKVFIDRVWEAIEKDGRRRRDKADHAVVQARLASMTPREREVLELVVAGKLSKQIARQLGISIKTVEVHRSNITRKMHVRSLAQLVRIVIEHSSSPSAVQ